MKKKFVVFLVVGLTAQADVYYYASSVKFRFFFIIFENAVFGFDDDATV